MLLCCSNTHFIKICHIHTVRFFILLLLFLSPAPIANWTPATKVAAPETPLAPKGPRLEDSPETAPEKVTKNRVPAANSRQSTLSAAYAPRGILGTSTPKGDKSATPPRVTFLENPPQKKRSASARPKTCTEDPSPKRARSSRPSGHSSFEGRSPRGRDYEPSHLKSPRSSLSFGDRGSR